MSEPQQLSPAFVEAFRYAAELHAGQERKGEDGRPYIGHLMSVAGIVIDAGGTEEQAIAALLHDAAEDQGGETQLREIERRFGPEVAAIVQGCSETLERPKPEWRRRKEDYIAHLDEVSPETLLVALADKVENARAIVREYRAVGDNLWSRFTTGSREDQLWFYRSLADAFGRLFPSPMTEELRRVVEELEQLVETRPTN